MMVQNQRLSLTSNTHLLLTIVVAVVFLLMAILLGLSMDIVSITVLHVEINANPFTGGDSAETSYTMHAVIRAFILGIGLSNS